MPIYKTKNEDFFKEWSHNMAYVLGFFAADGSMYETRRGTHFMEFQITDHDLLYKIRELMGSNHKITELHRFPSHKHIYRLQIGSKEIYSDLLRIGFTQAKSATVRVPEMPDTYFPDFLRGYFDGDGNVALGYYRKPDRKSLTRTFSARFTSGSRMLLTGIKDRLARAGLRGSFFFYGGAWRLQYGASDSEKLFYIMYSKNLDGLIYLERKYRIFQDALASKKNAGVA